VSDRAFPGEATMYLRTFTVLAAFAVALSLAAAAELPPPVYTRPPVPDRASLDRLNLAVQWDLTVPVDGPRDGLAIVQLIEDQVFVQTRSGLLLALDAERGEPLWRARLAEPYGNHFSLGYNSRTVFLLSRTYLYALDRRTGALDFSMELPTVASAGALADETNLYLALGGTRLSAYDLPRPVKQPPVALPPPGPKVPPAPPVRDKSYDPRSDLPIGDARQSTPSLAVLPSVVPPYRLPAGEIAPSLAVVPSVVPPYHMDIGNSSPSITFVQSVTQLGRLNERRQPFSLRPVWDYRSALRFDESPLMTAESLLQVSTDRTVLGLAKPQKQVLFSFDATDNISGPPGQYANTAFFGTEDGTVYAMNMLTGRIFWRVSTGGVVRRRPVATDADVFVSAGHAGLTRLDRKAGLEQWVNPDAQGFLAAGPRYVYGADKMGQLVILDRKRGLTLGKLDTRDFVVPVRNDQNDRVFLAANSGLLVCLRDRDLPKPVPVQAQEARDAVRPPKEPRPKPMPKPGEGDPAGEMPKKE
jgi:outer membrane protein assembly factor BamB